MSVTFSARFKNDVQDFPTPEAAVADYVTELHKIVDPSILALADAVIKAGLASTEQVYDPVTKVLTDSVTFANQELADLSAQTGFTGSFVTGNWVRV